MPRRRPRLLSALTQLRRQLFSSRIVVVLFLFVLISAQPSVLALTCYEGTNCDYKCAECTGVACLRVTRLPGSSRTMMGPPPVEPNDPQVALTCLPADTRFYELEPEGCRTNPITQLRTCVCYDHDYCNRGSHRTRHCTEYPIAFTVVLVVALVVRENL